jgi:hypothetical protein
MTDVRWSSGWTKAAKARMVGGLGDNSVEPGGSDHMELCTTLRGCCRPLQRFDFDSEKDGKLLEGLEQRQDLHLKV